VNSNWRQTKKSYHTCT